MVKQFQEETSYPAKHKNSVQFHTLAEDTEEECVSENETVEPVVKKITKTPIDQQPQLKPKYSLDWFLKERKKEIVTPTNRALALNPQHLAHFQQALQTFAGNVQLIFRLKEDDSEEFRTQLTGLFNEWYGCYDAGRPTTLAQWKSIPAVKELIDDQAGCVYFDKWYYWGKVFENQLFFPFRFQMVKLEEEQYQWPDHCLKLLQKYRIQ